MTEGVLRRHQYQRTLLVIAHEFPPVGGASVLRITKLLRYLAEFGWRAVVVTANLEDSGYDHPKLHDYALLESIRELVTIRYSASPVERFVRSLGRRYIGEPLQLASGAELGVSGGGHVLQILSRIVRRAYVFQDESGLWVPFAVRDALAIIERQRVDAIFTTSPPHLVHLAGYVCKTQSGLPWVADFRDGWTDNFVFRARSRRRRLVDHVIERAIVRAADATLVVTSAMLRSFCSSYPALATTFYLLRNGFDPADFPVGERRAAELPITFRHIGSIGGPRDPTALLQALRVVRESGDPPPESIAMQFIGSAVAVDPAMLPEAGAEFRGVVEHREAVRLMCESGVLVLLSGRRYGEGAFVSKVFEYIAARRPILALIPQPSELADVLRSYPLCVMAPPDDVPAIVAAIRTAHQMAGEADLERQIDSALVDQFSRREQARELAQLLDRLCLRSV